MKQTHSNKSVSSNNFVYVRYPIERTMRVANNSNSKNGDKDETNM